MKNVGNTDRAVRYGIAAVLIITGIFAEGMGRYALWAVSLVPILTATFRFCPLWVPFKINTYKR